MDYGNWFVSKLGMIPSIVVTNWPTFFGFAITEYATDMIVTVIPKMGGTIGSVERALVMGAGETIKFSTWQAMSGGYHK